jgi:hypothetical protein
VNAVLHYENRVELPRHTPLAAVDENMVESIVWRLLREERAAVQAAKPSEPKRGEKAQAPEPKEIVFDSALDAFGQDGIDAIAGVLNAFRRK